MIGSSSAAAVMLELVHAGRAPAALLMPEPDAILLLGIIVAREMGWPVPPAYRLSTEEQRKLHGKMVAIAADGVISVA
jgi:predicted aconitase with swiveling domain